MSGNFINTHTADKPTLLIARIGELSKNYSRIIREPFGTPSTIREPLKNHSRIVRNNKKKLFEECACSSDCHSPISSTNSVAHLAKHTVHTPADDPNCSHFFQVKKLFGKRKVFERQRFWRVFKVFFVYVCQPMLVTGVQAEFQVSGKFQLTL